MFNTLQWMTFPERVVYQKALQMYKTIHCDAPDYLTTSFTFTSEIHTRLIRSSSTYHSYTHKPRHELFHHSLTCYGASVWNTLPVNIQNASNVKQFKSLYLKSIYGFFGLPQHIMYTHPDQDMNYWNFDTSVFFSYQLL